MTRWSLLPVASAGTLTARHDGGIPRRQPPIRVTSGVRAICQGPRSLLPAQRLNDRPQFIRPPITSEPSTVALLASTRAARRLGLLIAFRGGGAPHRRQDQERRSAAKSKQGAFH
eukprot:scaffold16966_cov131-Isochrysis_galbana.AAC.1